EVAPIAYYVLRIRLTQYAIGWEKSMVTANQDWRPAAAAAVEREPFRFDYEDASTVEGRGELRTGTHDLAALRLERCLEAIAHERGKLLEVGCGAGRYTRAFLHYRPDLEVCGCDISHIA